MSHRDPIVPELLYYNFYSVSIKVQKKWKNEFMYLLFKNNNFKIELYKMEFIKFFIR